MRLAYVCADPGVPVFGTKGASVHVQEILRAWRARGAEVRLYATRVGDDVPADLADVPVVHVPVPFSPTFCYRGSADYVVGRLRAAGYAPRVQSFSFPFFQEVVPTTVAVPGPGEIGRAHV
nr:hypothetical protein [Kocuria sp. UCD-OTCP]